MPARIQARCVYVSGLNVRAPEPEVAMLLRREATRHGQVTGLVLHVDRWEFEFEGQGLANSNLDCQGWVSG